MTLWFAQVEVKAEAVLATDAGVIEYRSPDGAFIVRLMNKRICPLVDQPLLELHLMFEAPDIDAAHEQVAPTVRAFLRWLTFVTHSSFRISEVKRLIDWTPGVVVREQFMYHADRTDEPEEFIDQSILDTIRVLTSAQSPPAVGRALRWFATGVATELLDDKFQCFFFVLEIIAQLHKDVTPVPDTCAHCHSPLFCEACEEIPTHRPYAKQALQQLMPKIATDWLDAFDTINGVRNGVMHGESVEDIESRQSLSFADIVDKTGLAAWNAIMGSIRTTPGTHKLNICFANTFIRRTMTARFKMLLGTMGDAMNPRLEDMPAPTITVEPREMPAAPPDVTPPSGPTSQ